MSDNPLSPDYIEPPEGAFYSREAAIDHLEATLDIPRLVLWAETDNSMVWFDPDTDLFWVEEGVLTPDLKFLVALHALGHSWAEADEILDLAYDWRNKYGLGDH